MVRLLDFTKGLISLLLVAALLVGVPALLVIFIGFPLPTEAPSLELIRAHLADGDLPDPFLVKTLAVTVWLVWGQLATAIAVESVALVRGRLSGRAPVMPGIQTFVGKLVASTVLLVSAFAPSRSEAAAPLAPPAPIAEAEPFAAMGPGREMALVGGSHRAPRPERAPARSHLAGSGRPVGSAPLRDAIYTTRSGDNWWDVAERLLGDGLRWSELRTMNIGRTMVGGELVTGQTESVRPGWELLVPPDADPDLLDSTSPGAGVDRPASLVYQGPTGSELAGAGPPYQVVEGDNLWDIAERHLGDPFRWPEIFEASTDLLQPSGGRIVDPNLIWPDSIVLLPSDAADVPPADPALVREVVGAEWLAPSVEGEAEGEAEAEVAAGTRGTGGGELMADDLDRIMERLTEHVTALDDTHGTAGPEETAAMGSSPAAAGSAGPGPEPGGPGPGGPGPGGPGSRRGADAPEMADRILDPAALAIGSGTLLVATGLLGLLRRARRLRLAEIGEASVPQPPPADLVDIETVLRNGSDRPSAERLMASVASLGFGVTQVDEPAPSPEVIRVVGGRIEAVVDGSGDVPAHWREVPVTGGSLLPAGRRMMVAELDGLADMAGINGLDGAAGINGLDGAADPSAGDGSARTAGRERCPAPTMITVGGGLLLNLESVGVLAIDGPADLVAGLTRSAIHELATGFDGPTGSPIPVHVLVSDRLPGVEVHPTVRSGPLRRLVAELEPWVERVELAMAACGASAPWTVRAAGLAGSLPAPVVVVADGSADTDGPALASVVERARDRRLPLAVVLVGDPATRAITPSMTAAIADGHVRLEPHGLTAVYQALDTDLILGVEALIDHARRAPIIPRPEISWPVGDPLIDGPLAGGDGGRSDPSQVPTEETPEHDIETELPDEEEEEITDRSDDDDRGLLIRVLGPVEIEGGPDDLTDEQRSILAFLALGGPSTSDQIIDAVWPGQAVDPARFERLMAELRRELGPLLPTAGDGRHRVRSTITDLGSARRWIAQAEAMSGSRARNLLQLAVGEVRGRPFTGVSEAHWQWIEDHRLAVATQATSLLVDACFELCDGAYEADDLHLALRACEAASLIDPLQETVVVRRVQLLMLLERADEAEAVVERWEDDFARSAGRPAARGPRAALASSGESAGVG